MLVGPVAARLAAGLASKWQANVRLRTLNMMREACLSLIDDMWSSIEAESSSLGLSFRVLSFCRLSSTLVDSLSTSSAHDTVIRMTALYLDRWIVTVVHPTNGQLSCHPRWWTLH